MPSSGYGCGPDLTIEHLQLFEECFNRAKESKMEIEWLGCFIGAIEQKASFEEACNAGIIEWDL